MVVVVVVVAEVFELGAFFIALTGIFIVFIFSLFY